MADPSVTETFTRLVDLMARLRAPGGCPWDREQTPASLRPYLLEEVYEVLEAIDADDPAHLRDELGDLLLQIVFQSELAAEAGRFTVADVARAIVDKLVRRHPHVFGDVRVRDAGEVVRNWRRIKAEERRTAGEDGDLFAGVPAALPALLRAEQRGEKAGHVGLDWPDARGVLEKLHEETAELAAALAAGDRAAIEHELGDLLLAAASLGRHLAVSAEMALRAANDRFVARVRRLAAAGRGRGQAPTALPPATPLPAPGRPCSPPRGVAPPRPSLRLCLVVAPCAAGASATRLGPGIRSQTLRASHLEQGGVEARLLVARALQLQVQPAEHEERPLEIRGPAAAAAPVEQPARHAEPLGDLGGREPPLRQLGHVERAAQVGGEEGDDQERRDPLGVQLAEHPCGAGQVAAGEPIRQLLDLVGARRGRHRPHVLRLDARAGTDVERELVELARQHAQRRPAALDQLLHRRGRDLVAALARQADHPGRGGARAELREPEARPRAQARAEELAPLVRVARDHQDERPPAAERRQRVQHPGLIVLAQLVRVAEDDDLRAAEERRGATGRERA